MKRCFDGIFRENGQVDVLINNAGIERHGPVEELSMTHEQWVDWNALDDEDWYKAIETTFGMNARQGQ